MGASSVLSSVNDTPVPLSTMQASYTIDGKAGGELLDVHERLPPDADLAPPEEDVRKDSYWVLPESRKQMAFAIRTSDTSTMMPRPAISRRRPRRAPPARP